MTTSAWERLPADVRAAMLARGKERWATIYAGVATHNKVWRPLRSPMLTFAEYGAMTAFCDRLAELILQSCRRRARTVGDLRRLLGVPPGYIEFLDEEEVLSEDLLLAIRPDILLADGVAKVVECNIDSALGGAFDSDGIAERFVEAYAGDPALDSVRIEPPPSAVDARYFAMRDSLGLSEGAKVGLLFHMGGDYPDTQNPDKLIALLQPVCDRAKIAGLDVVVRPVEWLDLDDEGRVCVDGAPVDAVLRLFIPQDVPQGRGTDALASALREGTVKMFTSSAAWLLGNKTVFAWLWQDIDLMTPTDADLLRRHVPHTSLLTASVLDEAVARQSGLVLKPAGTYGGAGVVVGPDVSPSIWRESLSVALAAGGQVLQEYVAADRLAMHFIDMTTGEVVETEVPYCIAPYLFGRQPAGAYLRFQVPGAGAVVNLGQGALTSGLLLTD